jgi:hypothetical protein
VEAVGDHPNGMMLVEVSRTNTLEESPQAMADFAEKHKRGKVVITL